MPVPERAGRLHTLESRRDSRVICCQLRFKLLSHFERLPSPVRGESVAAGRVRGHQPMGTRP